VAESDLSIGGRIAAVLLGFVMLLIVGEVGLRILGYRPIFDVYAKPSIFWISDPELGWRHEPGSEGVYVGPRPWPVEFEETIKINSLGLRGPELVDVPADGYRVLAIGDSRTVAFEVAYEETFTALLEEKLTARLGKPTQVVNAGVRGYGTDQSYLFYRSQGRKLEPDLVVHMNTGNDSRNDITLHRERRPFGKGAFALRPDGELELVGVPVPEYPICSGYRLTRDFEVKEYSSTLARGICWLQLKLFDHSALFTFTSIVIQQSPALVHSLYYLGDSRVQYRKSLLALDYPNELTARLLQQLAEEVRSDGSHFVLLGRRSILSSLGPEAVEAAGGTIVAVDPVFGDDPREVRFVHDGHWNALGHERAAELLAPVIEELLRSRPPRRSAASVSAAAGAE
jgi:lysophospholipase L1-like esterase